MPNLKILTTVTYYLPGYEAGGPIRTLANMVDRLGDEFLFRIITADRDICDTKPYLGVRLDRWNKLSKEEVFYLSSSRRPLREFRKLLCETEYDVLYINSFFSVRFTILPLLLRLARLVPDKPVVLAPRGELNPGALKLKWLKKQIYLRVVKIIGLYRGIIWQASSEYEEADIRHWFGSSVPVVVAPNLVPAIHSFDALKKKSEKEAGSLKIVFLSRISRKKNLDTALKTLKGVNGKITFDIYGPMEDQLYWAECERIIADLSSHVDVTYHGSVAHDRVCQILNEHDIFFLPTLGENFGHVILEALCSGCPVLISDQTPWRNLEEKGVGWDLSLSKLEKFQDILQQCVDMNHEEYREWSDQALEYGLEVIEDERVVERNRKLFSGLMISE